MMMSTSLYQDPHCVVDFALAKLWVDRRAITLTRKEYELLSTLTANAGEIVPRGVLLRNVWGYGPDIRTRTLDVHIRRLRRKLGDYGEQYIETIFGVGYRFQPWREPKAFTVEPPMLRATA
ncbi:MAG: winged helix-turn-helix transcriptional regulator [Bryobacterales bacterium]|nr:winged helix-turn-helix transcriptional regulator [Bryobacterales bacterium]MBN8733268.1 winged helix-turn-helix transcriptional regulator [Acidobacteriota bacterium]